MKQKRAERIMEALKEMGLRQMLIVDPMSIYYLTGVYVEPFERFYALYLREDGKHVYFLNKLFTVPEDVGVEKVWYSDTDHVHGLLKIFLRLTRESDNNICCQRDTRHCGTDLIYQF